MNKPKPCVIGKYCQNHGFIHGAEAEELRQRIEALLDGWEPPDWPQALRAILDDVDARDALAWVEYRDRQPRQ